MPFSSWLRGLKRLLDARAAGAKKRRSLPHRARPACEPLEERLAPAVSFLGVAAGDATSSDVILWTRAQDSATTAGVSVKALVSTDPGISSGFFYSGTTDPTQDYTIHLDATGLQSGTTYYYQFVAADGTLSQEGTFKTAPAPTADVAVHFGFTGDADGLMRPYDAVSNVTAPGVPSFAQQKFDYFVWLGDTIYETASGSASTDNISPAVPSSSVASNLTGSGLTAMEAAYWAKYRQQLQPVNTGPDAGLGDNSAGLQGFFDSTGHYTLLDNHELGNKQLINGGAPEGSNPAGIGVDPTNPAFDVNTTGTYINQSPAFQALVQAYTDYQPIRTQTVNAPNDPRSNGTQQLYFEQQWGANSAFFNLDDRSYRDIRLKTPSGADDTGVRADNPGRTMLGQTQLAWIEQGLLAAQSAGTTWKFVAISSPIDQIGPIGGSFTINNSGDPNTTQPGYTNTESDGGKSWMGAYRFERNELLKFIADNHIDHVVFLSTDDHQVRINELGYFTQFDQNGTPIQSSYTRVPGAFEIVVGPIGATGPDGITDHSIANIQALAQSFSSQQQALGLDLIGLDPNFAGLINVSREGDPNANANRSPFDFYSPDTFNYADLKLSPDGQDLTVTVYGINSYAQNSFPQPSASNPVRQVLQFTIQNQWTEGTPTTDATVASFSTPFVPGNLLVSESLYQGTASTVSVGQILPPGQTLPPTGMGVQAIANGTYPTVFNNNTVDGSFGVTSPIYLDQLTTSGTLVGTPINLTAEAAAAGISLSTSFSSKSELALNLSPDGTAVTFMGYDSAINQLDVSNSNTPAVVDPTNPVPSIFQRAVGQIDANGDLQVTPVNAYSGNNGRAAILADGNYYLAGNAGNGSKSGPVSDLSNNTGVQMIAAGSTDPTTTVVGQVNGTFGSPNGYQRGFAVQQINPATGLPYGPADKTGKDDNFRGETIFNNTLYVTKGSGGNGVDTVYQVGTAGSLPTLADAGTEPITILPGFPTTLASSSSANFFPFGIWFANSTTLYVADEGDGKLADAASDPNAGLEKWSLVNGKWQLDYVLQNGLNLGAQYTVPGYPTGTNPVTGLPWGPETDGLRNITGKVNGDGTVTIYAITSTVSGSGDQGADPNKLVAVTDALSATTLPTTEKFVTLKSAGPGEVLRGVSFTPTPTLTGVSATIDWGDGTPASTGTVGLSGNTYTVAGSHTYKEEGTYPTKTTITYPGGHTTVSGTATVLDAALSATGQNIKGLEGLSTLPVTVATFKDLGGPEAVSHYSATINWGGPGTGSTTGTIVANGDGTFSVQGSFTYAKEGTYTVAVHIVHENGITADTTSTASIQDNIGILLLGPGKGALTASGNASVSVAGAGGAIVVDSGDPQAAIASGNARVSAADIDAAGTGASGNAAFVGAVDNNEPPVADPFASLAAPPVPAVVRSTSTLNISSSVTLQPGLYIGGIRISGNAHVTLAPGLYYLQGGGLSVSGHATLTDDGQGVMIYNAAAGGGDSISVGGQADVSLSGLTASQLAALGLTDARYVGLAIFQAPTATAALSVSGNGALNVTGTVYAADAAVSVTGNGALSLKGDATKKFGSHLLVADLLASGNGSVAVDASNNNLQLF
jgi:phosphodiesterase/alkaline phosphatase D-like protein